MILKICKDCKEEKNILEFYIRKDSKDGYRSNCKICQNVKAKPGTLKFQSKESSKAKIKITNALYWKNNKDELNIVKKEYRLNNKENLSKQKSEYYRNNKKEINFKNLKLRKKKLSQDPIFRLIENLRSSFRSLLKDKGFIKKSKTEDILGIPFKEFIIYIESKFEPWMTWSNRGLYNGEFNHGWDIDHIIPISIAIDEEDVIILNHYTNLQPLCSKINRYIKRDKLSY